MRTEVYVHASKDTMAGKGRELGLSEEAFGLFVYACYEVELTLDVDEATGKSRIVAVDGREVAE